MIGLILRVLLIWSLPICAAVVGVVLVILTRRVTPIVSWWLKSTAVFLSGLPVTAIGLVMVAIGIPFRTDHVETARPFSDPSFLAMWIWAAVRNPANYWSRNITGCDVTGSTVDVLYGPDLIDESHPGLHMLSGH